MKETQTFPVMFCISANPGEQISLYSLVHGINQHGICLTKACHVVNKRPNNGLVCSLCMFQVNTDGCTRFYLHALTFEKSGDEQLSVS